MLAFQMAVRWTSHNGSNLSQAVSGLHCSTISQFALLHPVTFLYSQTTSAIYCLIHPSFLREQAVWHVPLLKRCQHPGRGRASLTKPIDPEVLVFSDVLTLLTKMPVCYRVKGNWRWRLFSDRRCLSDSLDGKKEAKRTLRWSTCTFQPLLLCNSNLRSVSL